MLAPRVSPPRHAEGVSSTRRGEGSGEGVAQDCDVAGKNFGALSLVQQISVFPCGFTPPLTPPRQGEGNLCAYMGRAMEDATMHAPPGVKRPRAR